MAPAACCTPAEERCASLRPASHHHRCPAHLSCATPPHPHPWPRPAVMSADAQVRHAAFYAGVQALLYVLCYHMEPLLRPRPHKQHGGAHANGSLPSSGLAEAVAAQQRQQQAGQLAGQQQQGGAAGMPGSLGASGGTPGGSDGLMRSQAHAQVRRVGLVVLLRGAKRCAARPCLEPSTGSSHMACATIPDHSPPTPTPLGLPQREACADAVRALFAGPMPHLLQHSLDPLSGCARSVVAEFGRQARALGFADLARLVRDWERRQARGGAKQVRAGRAGSTCARGAGPAVRRALAPARARPPRAAPSRLTPCALTAPAWRPLPSPRSTASWSCSSPSTPTCCAAPPRTWRCPPRTCAGGGGTPRARCAPSWSPRTRRAPTPRASSCRMGRGRRAAPRRARAAAAPPARPPPPRATTAAAAATATATAPPAPAAAAATTRARSRTQATTSSAPALGPCPARAWAQTIVRASGRTCLARSRRRRGSSAGPRVRGHGGGRAGGWHGCSRVLRVVQGCLQDVPALLRDPPPPPPPSPPRRRAGSPTLGFTVPHHHGSLSSGGSPPYGVSPLGHPPTGLFGAPAAGVPPSLHTFGGAAPGGLHLGLAGSRP